MATQLVKETFRREAIKKAMEQGYSASIIDAISKADDTYSMKQALIKGANEFRSYKKEAFEAADDFGYGHDILIRIKDAKTVREITEIMQEARKNFDWDVENECVDVYEQRVTWAVEHPERLTQSKKQH